MIEEAPDKEVEPEEDKVKGFSKIDDDDIPF